MACFNLLDGISASCQTSVGGIKKVVFLSDDVEYVVSGGTITSLSGATSANTFLFEFKRNTGSMETTLQVGEGSNFYQTNVALVFSRMEATKRAAVNALLASEVKAIVFDANGQVWGLGADNPLTASAGGGATGTNATDANAYNVTMTDDSLELPMTLSAEAVSALEAIL